MYDVELMICKTEFTVHIPSSSTILDPFLYGGPCLQHVISHNHTQSSYIQSLDLNPSSRGVGDQLSICFFGADRRTYGELGSRKFMTIQDTRGNRAENTYKYYNFVRCGTHDL